MTVDVLIIGGGPAGSAAATVLAQCGHRVLLVDRPSTGRPALAESIPPSAQRILSALGMKGAVDAAGFQPWLGNTVWWGSTEPRVESFAPGASGYQVARDRFDTVLRDVAASAGAHVISGTVRDVDLALEEQRELRPDRLAPENQRELRTAYVARPDPQGRDQSLAPENQRERRTAYVARPEPVEGQDRDNDPQRVTATLVLDCSGRAGVVARKGLRVAEASHRTVALVGVWRAGAPWPAEQHGHTLVASHADGWAWSVPTADDTRYVTVMVDPERSHLTRGASALDVYLAELRKVQAFGPLLEQAALIDGPWGADASLYSTRAYTGPGFLLVGDAASFIDPLSSFGVKKALASGWLAGITANTMLKTPEMRDEALAFYERREREVVESFRRQTARYAESATEDSGHPFWEARVDLGLENQAELRTPDVAWPGLSGRDAEGNVARPGLSGRDAEGDVARPGPQGRDAELDVAWPGLSGRDAELDVARPGLSGRDAEGNVAWPGLSGRDAELDVARPGLSGRDAELDVARPGPQGRDEILAVLADLRARSEIHLQPGAQIRTAPNAAIRGQLIVMEDHLFAPAWPDGVRYLRNIDLLLLMRLAPEHRDVGALYDAVSNAQPGVSLPDFLGVLSTLIAHGALQHKV